MHLHRFIIKENLRSGAFRVVDAELLGQLRKVLRLKRGEKVVLADGKGNEAEAEITDFKGQFAEFLVGNILRNENEPARFVTLYCANLKRGNLELVAQKATEVGIKRIVPVLTNRTVKLEVRCDRLKEIIKEASEQAQRGLVPELYSITGFEEAMEGAKENDLNIFFHRDAVRKLINYESIRGKKIGVWIGPEGGWSEAELSRARENKFEITSLGRLTLRAETAAILASWLAVNL